MPIIEQTPEESTLSQGDVLQEVRLYSTKKCWGPDGGEAVIANKRLCLVVSRPCVARHKESVTVIAVERMEDGIPSDVSLLSRRIW
jgi:hypothetical protein